MCGFAGLINFDGRPVAAATLARMGASLMHRGPDDHGNFARGPVGFAFRRLAILDLSLAAHQPMELQGGRHVMVYNGEIYNYLELRRELEQQGCTFRSSGDSEVLLQAYATWGPDCLSRFNGMWAFLIYDRDRGTVFGARDRFGVKPLYRHLTPRGVCLASEIKAIRAAGGHHGGICWPVASRFLLLGRLEEDARTFYEDIEQVPPGHAFEVTLDGAWKQWAYWSLASVPLREVGEPVEEFRDLFEDAVSLRMRSDVPVGVCLSGGLDSTSIICSMARSRSALQARDAKPLLAFCYMASEYDESRYIDDTLAQTGALLRRLQVDPRGLWDRLPDFLRYQDEPVHSMTAMIGYELMRLAAADGVKVVLNGQGADETAAGYFSYFRDYWRTLVMDRHWSTAWREIGDHTGVHGGARAAAAAIALQQACLWRLYRLPPYRRLVASRRLRRARLHPWFRRELTTALDSDGFEGMDGRLDAALRHSVQVAPLPIYLRVEDRNSMAHSIEARLPFMDYRLVSLLFRLGPAWKLRGPWNKYVLREAMRERIPETVRSRVDKMGFPTPVGKWFAGDLFEPVQDLLASRAARERGIYDLDAIRRDLRHHAQGQVDASRSLFDVAQFEIWAGNMAAPVDRMPIRPDA
jgi:asparagine synthase (glutamine-hydrolysing)